MLDSLVVLFVTQNILLREHARGWQGKFIIIIIIIIIITEM